MKTYLKIVLLATLAIAGGLSALIAISGNVLQKGGGRSPEGGTQVVPVGPSSSVSKSAMELLKSGVFDQKALLEHFNEKVVEGRYQTAPEFIAVLRDILDPVRELVKKGLLAPEDFVSFVLDCSTQLRERFILKDLPPVKKASGELHKILNMAAVEFPLTLPAKVIKPVSQRTAVSEWPYADVVLTELVRRLIRDIKYGEDKNRLVAARQLIDEARGKLQGELLSKFASQVKDVANYLSSLGTGEKGLATLLREMMLGPSEGGTRVGLPEDPAMKELHRQLYPLKKQLTAAEERKQRYSGLFETHVIDKSSGNAEAFRMALNDILEPLKKEVTDGSISSEEYMSLVFYLEDRLAHRFILEDMPPVRDHENLVWSMLARAAVEFPVKRLENVKIPGGGSDMFYQFSSPWWFYSDNELLTDLARRFVRDVEYGSGDGRSKQASQIIDAVRKLPPEQRDKFFGDGPSRYLMQLRKDDPFASELRKIVSTPA